MNCDVGKANEQCSFSNLSFTSPTSQLILQPFHRFIYITDDSPTLPLLHLRHISFSNPSVASPTSQIILQPFRCYTYIIVHSLTLPSLLLAHSPTFPTLHLHHSLFSNPSVAFPTSQFILQPFRCFNYITAHSPTLISLLLRPSSSLTSPGEPPMNYFTKRRKI